MTYVNNEIKRRYFKFEITNPNTSATGNNAGFIDAMEAQNYTDFNPTAGTVALYTAKALGYIRWCNLVLALSQFGVFFEEVNEITGATSTTTPTKITFTMGYEQADDMYLKIDGTEYTDVNALKKLVVDVLTGDFRSFAHVYDPTLDTETRGGKRLPSGGPAGMTEKFLTAEKICATASAAQSCITITEMGRLTVYPIPADASVTLTATGHTQDGHTIFVDNGDTVSYTVSKTGLETQTGSVTVSNEKNIKVELH